MSLNPPELAPLQVTGLSKGPPTMPIDHTDPANNALKPGLSSSEGKIAMLVVVVTTLGPLITALAGAMPDNQWVQIAVIVVGSITSILVTLGYIKKRGDMKENANDRAADLALADKATAAIDKVATIAKEHPELAAALLKSAGVGVSVPK